MNTNDSNKMDVMTQCCRIPLVIPVPVGSPSTNEQKPPRLCRAERDKNEALLHRFYYFIPVPFPDAFQQPHCTMLSWRALKDQGRVEYDRGNYEQALSLYQQALSSAATAGLSSTTSILDRQVILSNIVACRLKLGQNDRAVQDAQECIRLNPSWSKAHVRLASAYIALGRSNDACNALQTAIRHDSCNATARQMLLQQLRRDNRPPPHQQQSSQQQQSRQHPNMDQSHGVEDSNRDTSAGNATAAGTGDNNNNNNDSTRSDDVPSPPSPQHRPAAAAAATNLDNDDNVDDTMSLIDRWRANGNRLKHWYTSQSESRQSGIKLLLGLLVLYISFGGRFGLVGDNSRWSHHRGDHYNSRADQAARRNTAAASAGRYHNADDDTYYQQQPQQQQRPQRQHHEYRSSQQRRATDDASSYYSSNRGYDGYSSSSSSNGDHHNSYRRSEYDRRSGSSRGYNNRYMNGDSGAPPWRLILLVLAGAYVCRINGINPLPIALVLLRGFGGIGGIMYGGGFGGGFGGFGGRPHHYYRPARRGRMW
jgi:tetratricopeptide (TPR) repeat protein